MKTNEKRIKNQQTYKGTTKNFIIAFSSGGRVKISSEPGGKQVLVIKDAGLEDEGEYSCKAVSAEGESSADGESIHKGELSGVGKARQGNFLFCD